MIAESPFDGDSFAISLRGATLDFHRANAAEEAVFYARGKNPERYVYRKPPAEDDGWPVASVEEVGISRDDITKFVQMIIDTPVEEHSVDIHGVLNATARKARARRIFSRLQSRGAARHAVGVVKSRRCSSALPECTASRSTHRLLCTP